MDNKDVLHQSFGGVSRVRSKLATVLVGLLDVGGCAGRPHRGRLLVGVRTPADGSEREGHGSWGRCWQSRDRASLADRNRRCGSRHQGSGRDGLVGVIVTTLAAESVAGSAQIKVDTAETLEHDHGDDPEAEERPPAHCDPEIDGDRAPVRRVHSDFGRGLRLAGSLPLFSSALAGHLQEELEEVVEELWPVS